MWGFSKSKHLKMVYMILKLWKCSVFFQKYLQLVLSSGGSPCYYVTFYRYSASCFPALHFTTSALFSKWLTNVLYHLKYLCHKFVHVIMVWFPGKCISLLKFISNEMFYSVTLTLCLKKVWQHYKSAFLTPNFKSGIRCSILFLLLQYKHIQYAVCLHGLGSLCCLFYSQ